LLEHVTNFSRHKIIFKEKELEDSPIILLKNNTHLYIVETRDIQFRLQIEQMGHADSGVRHSFPRRVGLLRWDVVKRHTSHSQDGPRAKAAGTSTCDPHTVSQTRIGGVPEINTGRSPYYRGVLEIQDKVRAVIQLISRLLLKLMLGDGDDPRCNRWRLKRLWTNSWPFYGDRRLTKEARSTTASAASSTTASPHEEGSRRVVDSNWHHHHYATLRQPYWNHHHRVRSLVQSEHNKKNAPLAWIRWIRY